MYPTGSAPRSRDAFSCTFTGVVLGPTEDHNYHDVHHALTLAKFTCFTGREPDRQEQKAPSTTLGVFEFASTRLRTTATWDYRNNNTLVNRYSFEFEEVSCTGVCDCVYYLRIKASLRLPWNHHYTGSRHYQDLHKPDFYFQHDALQCPS
jgi:hypothetical protein